MPHLMDAQLDPGAADVLRRQFDQMGLCTHLATRTTGVLGNGHVRAWRSRTATRWNAILS